MEMDDVKWDGEEDGEECGQNRGDEVMSLNRGAASL